MEKKKNEKEHGYLYGGILFYFYTKVLIKIPYRKSRNKFIIEIV